MEGATKGNSVMVDAVLVREISTVRVDKRSSQGTDDVEVMGNVTGRRLISRDELVRDYETAYGGKVRLIRMRNNKQYIMLHRLNIMCKIQITKEKEGMRFIVGLQDNSKTIYKKIPAKLIPKMFIIPMQPALNGEANKEVVEPVIKNVLNNPKPELLGSTSVKPKAETKSIRGKYIVVGKLTTIKGKDVGFVIEDGTGNKKQISYATAKKLVENKAITNMEIVNKNGKWFFRGNGIALESLRKFIL